MSAIFIYRSTPRHFEQVPVLESLFLFLILPLVACPLWGQVVQKKALTPDHYALWGEVNLERISPDQKWASYKMTYENGSDTLIVRNILSKEAYTFPGAFNGRFGSHDVFFFQSGNSLEILNLSVASREKINNVQNITYCEDADQLIIQLKAHQEKSTLLIRSLKTNYNKQINNVVHYSLSEYGAWLAYTTQMGGKNKVSIVNLNKNSNPNEILIDSSETISGLTWHKNGSALAFLRAANGEKISGLYYYIPAQKKLYQLDAAVHSDLNKTESIVYDQNSRLLISEDLSRVFFSIQDNDTDLVNQNASIVEIWNGNDKWIYPYQNNPANRKARPTLVFWLPLLNQIKRVTSNQLPNVILTSDLQFALLSDPKAYEPQFEQNGPRDFYVLNLKTFEKKLFLKKQAIDPLAFNASPGGRYFAYFKDQNWWIYDFKTGNHNNITAKTGVKFTAKEHALVPESICGNPGWTKGDNEIIIYDKYDLWAASPNGSSIRRLTKGRESGIKYRIAGPPNQFGIKYLFDGLILEEFDLNEGLFLTARGPTGETGYFRWKKSGGEKPIVYGSSLVDQINYSKLKQNIFFREQKFDMPPRLVQSGISNSKKYFFNSNKQHKNYLWGSSRLIEYQNSKGTKLKGTLFYPAAYDPLKKYPMIVNIYEIQSTELHVYKNPTYYQENGFNISVLTSEGYFVFLPDIALEYQNPGFSAADCVIASVKKVLELNIVDPKKIGLTGHSFGGYECSFTLTQTSLFSAAIASGGITDLFSYFHTINKGTGQPDMWRFESDHWNMGKTPYEIPIAYQTNSPMNHVQNIKTPVLIWSGKQDTQVDTHQSLQFYLALRRLGKKSCMLLYPNQSHLIMNPEQQKDLTIKTLQWFNYFLKDDKSTTWISKSIE